MSSSAYRPDIDGLRAVAIVPVVLFHAGLGGFKGGFVGVDVFFVISGYLITSLIEGEIRERRFSIVAFYERRIRRIFPALLTMILCVSAGAALILLPDDFRAFGRSVAATALFGSNVLFWSESGYFDAAAETKPLLHTWSLAVEEQFYILFPLFLVAAHRLLEGRWGRALVPVIAMSFLWSVLQVSSEPASAFYLAQSRAWELLLGALIALQAVPPLRSQAARELAGGAGLALIAFSTLAFSAQTPFPGFAALLPCAGAFLLIHAGSGPAPTLTRRLLSLRPLVFVGLISYPLYLWHWPLLALAKRLALRPLTPMEVLDIVASSVALAALTWKFIEQPIRRRGGSGAIGRGPLFAGAAAGLVAATGFGMLAAAFPHSIALQGDYVARHIRGREDYRDRNCFMGVDQSYAEWSAAGSCLVDHHARRTVLVWGDSFAAHYIPGLATNPAADGLNFLQYSAYSCPPVLGARIPWAPNCADFNSHLKDVLSRYRIDTAVVVARWERYWGRQVSREAVGQTLAYLRARGISVVLVGQGPSFAFEDPAEYRFRTGRDHSRSKPAEHINTELRAAAGYNAFFDPNGFLCPQGDCELARGQRFLYWDSGHYSTYGSELISGELLRAIASSSP